MTWAKIALAVLDLFRWLARAFERHKAEEAGRIKEAERQREASDDTLRRVDGARPDSVSDDEAFGPR